MSYNSSKKFQSYMNPQDLEEEEFINCIDDVIDDIHKNKELTSNSILNHRNFVIFIRKLLNMLGNPSSNLVGNIVFVLGTLLEYELGRNKILKIMKDFSDGDNFSFNNLVELLASTEDDVIMNAAGTIGTLIESKEGRQFLMENLKSLSGFLNMIQKLLKSSNVWTSSNAALIIARLCLDNKMMEQILEYRLLENIMRSLIKCLGIDTSGKGMNSAFALGRLLDSPKVWKNFNNMFIKFHLIKRLTLMSNCSDLSIMKNSCFCLSTIASNKKGIELILSENKSSVLMESFEKNLLLNDEEAVWFVLMTLKTISSYPEGIKFIRNFPNIASKIKECQENVLFTEEIKAECIAILRNLSDISTPSSPEVKLLSPHEAYITWIYPEQQRDSKMRCHLYYRQNDDEVLVYRGFGSEVTLHNLEPNTRYEFYLRISDDIDMTPPSTICVVTTDEAVSSQPTNLRILVKTPSQLKVAWDEPDNPNGCIRYYNIIIGKCDSSWKKFIRRHLFQYTLGSKAGKCTEQTAEKTSIISGLQAETKYTISVNAVNGAGAGEITTIEAYTLQSGAHAPSKPNVAVLGRFEVHISWTSPEELLGRLFRYEVLQDGKRVVYSGTDTYCRLNSLQPDKEYVFSVVAVTSDGRFESKPCKKRTAKDEYANVIRRESYEMQSEVSKDSNNSDTLGKDRLQRFLKKSTKTAVLRKNNNNKQISDNTNKPTKKMIVGPQRKENNLSSVPSRHLVSLPIPDHNKFQPDLEVQQSEDCVGVVNSDISCTINSEFANLPVSSPCHATSAVHGISNILTNSVSSISLDSDSDKPSSYSHKVMKKTS